MSTSGIHGRLAGRRSGRAGLALGTTTVLFVGWAQLGLAQPSPAASGNAGAVSLQAAPCRPTTTDPSVEAPEYAVQLGANPKPDGWWCQLPHPTELPTGFDGLQRSVAPLPKGQASYADLYWEKTPGSPTSDNATTMSSSVPKGRSPSHRGQAHGKTVAVAPGVKATLSTKSGTITLTWTLPRSGVPAYLAAVSTVQVSGSRLPQAVVVAVAKHVRPD